MEINNKKNHLSRIEVIFIMLLFTMCLTMNVFFCSSYNPYELLDKTTGIETWTISESNAINGDGETISKNICTPPIIAAIPMGISLFPFLIIAFLFFFLTLFILLPDGWTLINQKVRLDN